MIYTAVLLDAVFIASKFTGKFASWVGRLLLKHTNHPWQTYCFSHHALWIYIFILLWYSALVSTCCPLLLLLHTERGGARLCTRRASHPWRCNYKVEQAALNGCLGCSVPPGAPQHLGCWCVQRHVCWRGCCVTVSLCDGSSTHRCWCGEHLYQWLLPSSTAGGWWWWWRGFHVPYPDGAIVPTCCHFARLGGTPCHTRHFALMPTQFIHVAR